MSPKVFLTPKRSFGGSWGGGGDNSLRTTAAGSKKRENQLLSLRHQTALWLAKEPGPVAATAAGKNKKKMAANGEKEDESGGGRKSIRRATQRPTDVVAMSPAPSPKGFRRAIDTC
ncbi:hypothetical protein L596_025909 [Steinernema carpocapsae]|uniref:Uncharacterized protein n=1 Tax=Steinernema carpocapsae TaxID=34508 RepID=A0A4U5M974_STECR|nr:hypothetical protein L596_025909 [Steinernema carpocapsae]